MKFCSPTFSRLCADRSRIGKTVCILFVFIAIPAVAAIINPISNTSFSGGTSYGATNYVALGNANPTYIANNFTGRNDILSSPGGGYQTANPVVGNNVASTGIVNNPYGFSWLGGVAPTSGATFGSGSTVVTSTGIGFALSDTTVGCCTASYMVTSIDNDFVVNAGGYNGSFGAYLSISGINQTVNDAAVASEIVEYSINGGAFIAMPQLVLAAGGNCNNVAIGGAGGGNAAVLETGCNGNAFTGLAIDNLGNVNWIAGTTIQIIATITAYADPPSSGDTIDSYIPDLSLISDTGTTLPGFTGGADSGAAAPEPATLALGGLALTAIFFRYRRTRQARF